MKILQIALAIVFLINCSICVLFVSLPKENAIAKSILDSDADDVGAMELKVTVARQYAEELKQHWAASQAGIATGVINSAFLLFLAIFLVSRRKENTEGDG